MSHDWMTREDAIARFVAMRDQRDASALFVHGLARNDDSGETRVFYSWRLTVPPALFWTCPVSRLREPAPHRVGPVLAEDSPGRASPAANGSWRGFWRHYKGGVYFVLGIAVDDASNEEFVIYESVQSVNDIVPVARFRTVREFVEEVWIETRAAEIDRGAEGEWGPRFRRVQDPEELHP